eukprot:1177206-Amphidinium_carterae.1
MRPRSQLGFDQSHLKRMQRVSPAAPEAQVCIGDVFVHGSGECDQLGLGDHQRERQKPTVVQSLSAESITTLSCGALHTLCVTADGRLFSWGCNDDGALGRA